MNAERGDVTLRNGQVTTRKARPCAVCPDGRIIPAGSPCWSTAIIGDRGFRAEHTCLGTPCLVASSALVPATVLGEDEHAF
ncbi:hypothetical protein GOFOIKOB_0010 [Methylobacterium tardum]|uniref:Uncharacterized protein n=2 Tax=Methylobacterium tardum TaxID=374432 RepID=A0AA37WU02_9HYPH|nr:hypothetical protein GOFOIKOB_0010 [Methylobacterium tardum]GLS71637.1 hypothetical protein GCM10007890_36500 [Methylobacterium tardum]